MGQRRPACAAHCRSITDRSTELSAGNQLTDAWQPLLSYRVDFGNFERASRNNFYLGGQVSQCMLCYLGGDEILLALCSYVSTGVYVPGQLPLQRIFCTSRTKSRSSAKSSGNFSSSSSAPTRFWWPPRLSRLFIGL